MGRSRAIYITKIWVMISGFLLISGVYFGIAPEFERVSSNVTGPPASHTGAPGEFLCTVCHIGGENELGVGSVTISGLPAGYQPGQQIPITVTVAEQNQVAFGFQITAVDSLGMAAGTFTLPNGTNQMQMISGQVGPNIRSYVEHTAPGTIPTQFGTKSWTFTWNAPAQDIGTIGFYAGGNAANGDGDSTGDNIYRTSENLPFAAPPQVSSPVDFDGDGRTEISIHRPSLGQWWYLRSSDQGVRAFTFGDSNDIPIPADYTGDGLADVAFFRPTTGEWFFLRSEDTTFFAFPFGTNGDIPAPGDFDGDGTTDVAVYRPATGQWFILRSSDSGVTALPFGILEDRPIPADYDGDGMADVAVFRPSVQEWWILRSSGGVNAYQFGTPGDRTVQGDYTGDGRADVAFWRPATGEWFVIRSEDNSFFAFPWGASGDVPTPGDYDGDGVFDAAVWREAQNGTWFILGSTSGFQTAPFGAPNDVPLPSLYTAP